jgi:signal transduction histidine kinase/integral membrane sensor domain MASE1
MAWHRLRASAEVLAVAFVYFVAGRLGQSLASHHQSVSGFWPPSGIALAAVLLLGERIWPAIYIGSFAVNLTTSHAPIASLVIASGNTFGCLVGAWMIRRFAGGLAAFETAPAILLFAELVIASSIIAPTIGLVALFAGNLVGNASPGAIWYMWWLGDATGALVLTPLIVYWARGNFEDWSSRKGIEALFLFVTVVLTGYAIFAGTPAEQRYPLEFLVYPSLLIVALRFGPRETITAIVVLTAFAVAGTVTGVGPFVRASRFESILLLQAFVATSAVASLALATEAARRREMEREVLQFNSELTQRVEARTDDLRRLHGRLAEAQHVAHLGSWEWTIGADVVWWSEELYRIFDLPVASPVTYSTFLDRVHPDDRGHVNARVRRAIDTTEPFSFEHRIVRRDGTVRVVSTQGRVITDEHGRARRMLGIGHDITQRKQAEAERLQLLREQEARREAEALNRSKDQFLRTLSHELRTPLNAVLGWADILRSANSDEEVRERALDAIVRNTSIQAQLVSDILDVARIRSGTLRVDPQPILLREVIDGAVEIIAPMMASKNIGVRVSIAPGAEKLVGDGQRLQQVFWNLLSNAAKFVPVNGHVDVAATVGAGDDLHIAVLDDGPGIDPDFLPHVFEEFSQADDSIARQYGGLGLGLAITKHLVRLHAGDISASNRPEGGAAFRIRLPLQETPD